MSNGNDTDALYRIRIDHNLSRYDPAHCGHAGIHQQDFCDQIVQERYMQGGETWWETCLRVARGVLQDSTGDQVDYVTKAMSKGLWVPGGRIWTGAGTDSDVTLMNCYVSGVFEDSLPSIYKRLGEAARTISFGGGIGYDFTPIRPKGAYISGAKAGASGPIEFMKVFDQSCKVIEQAGNRRGAQMAMLSVSHPDILEYIRAKSEPGVLTQFNLSVAVPDAFMRAVEVDDMWPLEHVAPPDREAAKHPLAKGAVYSYKRVRAREIWDAIMRNTYEYSEPGVFFIDTVNSKNPLKWHEVITTTNPCGEQPLPPYGNCNLGAINLARLVRHPFTDRSSFYWQGLHALTRMGVAFLDKVIDITNYPLEEQRIEGLNKRRIGLGVTGLANCLEFLGLEYDSDAGRAFAGRIISSMLETARWESQRLSIVYGPAPVFLNEKKDDQRRNGTLLTIAPTGTTSIIVGNVSSGIEPTFAAEIRRTVRAPGQGDQTSDHSVYDYAEVIRKSLTEELLGGELPSKLVNTVDNVSIEGHLKMQSALQMYVDASISKTINLPEDISFEAFQGVYGSAWQLGLKSCTTYRPSKVRGAILVAEDQDQDQDQTGPHGPEIEGEQETVLQIEDQSEAQVEVQVQKASSLRPTPRVLAGNTYRLNWPEDNIYVTINRSEGNIKEIFLNAKNEGDWMRAFSIVLTRLINQGVAPLKVVNDLASIKGDTNGALIQGRWHPSKIAAIGYIIELDEQRHRNRVLPVDMQLKLPSSGCPGGGPDCVLIREEGCTNCKTCGWGKCD